MATAQSKLDILINARNNASGPLKQIAADAGGLERTLIGIGQGIAAGITVSAVKELAETGFEMARASAQADRLGDAFDGLATRAGQSSAEMLGDLQEASDGTIANADLMLSANRAMLLGVADSGEEMAALMEVAAARGKAMGSSTSQAFADIVTGIGRESAMILDNLGIVVDAEAANAAYAQSLGKTTEQLTDAERKQALLNQVIASSTDIVRANEAAGRDAAANFERMDASIQNAKDALGKLFEPAMVVVAQAIAAAAEQAAHEMEAMAAPAVQTRTDMAMLDQATIGLTNDIGQLEQGMRRLEAAGQTNTEQYRQAQAELARLKGELAQTKSAHDALIPSIQLANQDFQALGITADEARRRIAAAGDDALNTGSKLRAMGADALAAMDAFNQAMSLSQGIARSIDQAGASAGAFFAGKQGGDAGLSRQKALTSELKAQVDAWKEQGYTEKEISEVLLPGMVSQINEADRALFNTSVSTKALKDEAREAEQAFNELKGKVAGVLSGALDTGTGVDPDKVLESLGIPRADAINENARRLADIAANGLKGQDWLGAFQSEVPDIWQMLRLASNPQEEAAHLLRDFQDGLLTSAIDKDKAKEIVKRQILGDQNMAALAQEIAGELAAEMGVPLQQALGAAQGALGVSGTSGAAGESAATSFSDGANQAIEGSDAGGSFVDKFIAQTQARYANIKTAGGEAGRQWGQGFLAVVGDNVPPGLISLLTDLVTPGVMAKFAQQGTLTNAAP